VGCYIYSVSGSTQQSILSLHSLLKDTVEAAYIKEELKKKKKGGENWNIMTCTEAK